MNASPTLPTFYAIHLECLLALWGIIILLVDAFIPTKDKRAIGYMAAGFVAVALLYSFLLQPVDGTFFHGMYRFDAFALYFKRLFLLALALVLVMAAEFSDRIESGVPEFYALLMFCAAGMLILASVNDFILLFVALELVTITFYILASYLRRQVQSLEAGTKYLILGALSSGFNVYGIAYIFGTTGTTNFDQLSHQLSAISGQPTAAFTFGMLLVLTGIGFKIASVPFQIWVPDVYQGAPTPVTAFLAVGSKAAGFALLMRVLYAGLLPVNAVWNTLIMVLGRSDVVIRQSRRDSAKQHQAAAGLFLNWSCRLYADGYIRRQRVGCWRRAVLSRSVRVYRPLCIPGNRCGDEGDR